MKGIFRIHRWI